MEFDGGCFFVFLQGPGKWAVCPIYSGRVPDCGSQGVMLGKER